MASDKIESAKVDILLTRGNAVVALVVAILTVLVFPAYSWVSGLEKKIVGFDTMISERAQTRKANDDRMGQMERDIGALKTQLATVQTSAEASERYLRTLIEWERESRRDQGKAVGLSR